MQKFPDEFMFRQWWLEIRHPDDKALGPQDLECAAVPNHAVPWPERSPLLALSALLSGLVQNGKQTPNLEGACSFLGKSRMLPHPHSSVSLV